VITADASRRKLSAIHRPQLHSHSGMTQDCSWLRLNEFFACDPEKKADATWLTVSGTLSRLRTVDVEFFTAGRTLLRWVPSQSPLIPPISQWLWRWYGGIAEFIGVTRSHSLAHH
jgi:hypothetical protein